ncbi:MAG: hypothetical protein CL521_01850 [Actinobacteria bacterium]|nr:hypothetical protein [Actinomycetota bacterium]
MIKKLLFIACFLSISSASIAENIGYVDLEQVAQKTSLLEKYQKQLEGLQEDLQKIYEKQEKKLKKAQENGKSEEEIQKILTSLQEEARPKQEAIQALEIQFNQTMMSTLLQTSQKVAKEYGIDIVLDKRVVFFGGFNLTDFVIEKINE